MLSPFDPRHLHAAVRTVRHAARVTVPGPLGAPASAVLVPADPARVWLLLMRYDPSGPVQAVPVGLAGGGCVSIPAGDTHTVIHAATLPGLLAGEWHVFIPADPGYSVHSGSSYSPQEV